MKGRVFIIAGSDSGGGAGIQADIKTVTVLGGYAATAITALTAQNTLGVHGVFPVPPAFISKQIEVVLSDIGADAIKIGMLHSAAVIEAVAGALRLYAPGVPVVLDPVMMAKGGAALLEPQAISALQRELLPIAAVITPNIPELEALGGEAVIRADAPGAALLLKGGHGEGEILEDTLIQPDGQRFTLTAKRQHTRHTHGTGCTYSSAIACGLAQGLTVEAAVRRGFEYVQQAITNAPGFGAGHGALGHNIFYKTPTNVS
ncbi:MAG: bifunctional hydroxymethylpyrimidine kinase/phosphomethylpyrimidine kinase [Thalassospira sp.]|jgi:hydroxymethylpyrimidine/phosphomethylpyrimidine kinase|nr:bifunctional hydroxymethylpyrimidine kinase/phosphomethylpyrimidine kinase [Thalassospira sp.]